jgi:16S rRNA (guanine527-N7)-methyltransferase
VAAKLGSLAADAAAQLGVPLEEPARRAIEAWLERLQEWNARIDLTAARTAEELVDLMLADALVLAPHLPPAARVIDVGTGAGAPGLALAILRPDLHMSLVEPLGKRVSFLRTVVGAIGRADIAVERARGDAMAGTQGWDVAVSRATLAAPAWLDLGVALAAPQGQVWVLLAKDAAPSHVRATLEREHAYTWPLTGATRKAVSYRVG